MGLNPSPSPSENFESVLVLTSASFSANLGASQVIKVLGTIKCLTAVRPIFIFGLCRFANGESSSYWQPMANRRVKSAVFYFV